MKPDVVRAAGFLRFLHAFQSVERVAYAADATRRENDVEHSYFLAMLCWYLVDALKLDYSVEKILRYALSHDLVEAYAGDSYIFDAESQRTKKEREKNAQHRIQSEFPEFETLHATIEAYEHQEDPESEFVHAVDKLIPVILNYLQNGRMWKDMKVDYKQLIAQKRAKVGEQKEVRELLEQIITLLQDDWESYFIA